MLSLRIHGAHASHVALEVALGDEIGEHHLLEHGLLRSGELARGRQRRDERWRRDDEADAERGEGLMTPKISDSRPQVGRRTTFQRGTIYTPGKLPLPCAVAIFLPSAETVARAL